MRLLKKNKCKMGRGRNFENASFFDGGNGMKVNDNKGTEIQFSWCNKEEPLVWVAELIPVVLFHP